MFYEVTQKIIFLNPRITFGESPPLIHATISSSNFIRGGVRAILFTLIIVLRSRYRYKVASEQIHAYVMYDDPDPRFTGQR